MEQEVAQDGGKKKPIVPEITEHVWGDSGARWQCKMEGGQDSGALQDKCERIGGGVC